MTNGVLTPTQLQSLNQQLPTLIAELPAPAAAVNGGVGAAPAAAQSWIGSLFASVRSGFSVINVLYGIGGIVVVLAAVFLLALAFQTMGGFGVFVCVTSSPPLAIAIARPDLRPVGWRGVWMG